MSTAVCILYGDGMAASYIENAFQVGIMVITVCTVCIMTQDNMSWVSQHHGTLNARFTQTAKV